LLVTLSKLLPSTHKDPDVADANDFNRQIIEEFRGNGGKVGGMFENSTLLILHSKGAKSGAERVHPMIYRNVEGGGMAVFASNSGADTHPAWFHNLMASPEASVEVGSETGVKVRARNTEGAERDSLFEDVKASFPGFAEYEKGTDRVIPVLVLERG
jgi:deazaflavin-dependent oxidoreductase (nitroreductase family)